jgi:uncharacterized membrane protein YidH (DUF202 family)
MTGLLLTDNNLLAVILQQPGLLLFGLVLVLFGAAVAQVFLLKNHSHISTSLVAILLVIFISLLGILTFDLAGTGGSLYTLESISSLSELMSTHRWLLIQVPLILVPTAIVCLLVYKERLGDSHAKEYRWAIIISILVSFASLLIIGFESMF